MSFKAELQSLIANASSSLEDLEGIFRRAQLLLDQANNFEAGDGNVGDIQAKLDTVRQRILTSLDAIQESYSHDQERLGELAGELKLDLENVRQCAIDYFIKGEYRECVGLLTFLSKVQPHDENLANFLDLSHRIQLEHEGERIGAAHDSQFRSKHTSSDQPQQLPNEPPVEENSKGNAGGVGREPLLRKTEGTPQSPPPEARDADDPLRLSQSDPSLLDPQILAEIELKTAAYINETYRSLPRPTTPRVVVWVTVVGVLSATTLFWLSRPRPGSSTPESLSPQHSKVTEQVLPLSVPKSQAEKESPALAMATDRASFQPSSAKVQTPSERNSARERLTFPNGVASAPASVSRTTSSGLLATTPQIGPDLLLELDGRIQAKDFDRARLLLARLESEFPGNPEIRTLGERLRVDAGKQQSLALMWIEKAWAAQIAGRYVTPREDNVLVYCNLAVEADPGNQRAADLKKEIVKRAVAQADEWIQRGKFDAARLYYASMDYLASGDAAFPYPRAELKRELDKLEFTAYPVVHDHRFGSCLGILKFNSHAVSYVPSGDSVDGFLENLKSISTREDGRWLSITYRDKTFRFKRENGTSIGTIYQGLIDRIANERSILASSNN